MMIFAWIQRITGVKKHEWHALLWSFSYFFALLCAYYILRPMRDEMGIAGGVENLHWMFSGTFIAMLLVMPLFGWVSSRYPRSRFLPYSYGFFILNLLLFYVLFQSGITHAYVARAFFIWVSVFNLFVVSVFWSFMTDIFNNAQAKRLFGFIAAGGTGGAVAGPALTAILAVPLGPTNLLLVSTALLGWAILCIHRLNAYQQVDNGVDNRVGNRAGSGAGRTEKNKNQADKVIGGGIFAGIRLVLQSPYLWGICMLILIFTSLATFLYIQQAQIIRDYFTSPAERTAVFAMIDFVVNVLTILIQLLLTARIIKYIGLPWTLAVIPLLLGVGFIMLGFAPVLTVIVAVQIIRRAGNYAIMRPAREMLYVVLSREEKYKAKNFIDTVVYRGGDMVSSWVYNGLRGAGFSPATIAWLAVPIAGLWAVLAYRLGRQQQKLSTKLEEKPGGS